MAVSIRESRQCVIWFGAPETRQTQEILLNGWQVRAVDPAQSMRFGLRNGDIVVGVVSLPAYHEGAQTEHLANFLNEHAYLWLIGMGEAGTLPYAEILSRRCNERIADETAELLQALDRAVQHLGSSPASACDRELLGKSAAMLSVRTTIRKFAPVDLPVLVTGETGTGKEMVARALHLHSPRRQGPFRAINCGAISPSLVQSELFGHERGAFTGASARRQGLFETADKGTVFLDEIGDLPLDAQTNLLRVLQEGTFERVGGSQPIHANTRVIAATHVDLEHAVARGKFREDLYYRLNVLRIAIPPLSQRCEDIPLLANHFLEQFRHKHCVRARGFCSRARQAMKTFSWPGNVRELLNRVQRAAVVCESDLITCEALGLTTHGQTDVQRESLRHLDALKAVAERETLLSCLEKAHYNISACARMMNVSRVTVYRLCRKHQVLPQALRQ